MSLARPVPRAVLAALALVLALLAGCGDTAPIPSTGSTSQEVVVQRCSTDCDCGFGAVCSSGVCEPDFGPFNQCYCAARDCAAGQACTSGYCTAQPTTCQTDCDCGFGSFCSSGACMPDFSPPNQCYCAARDCAAGQACTNGYCTAQPTTCRSNCDCGFGNVCSSGVCQPDFGPFDQCYCSARDCGAGQVCAGGVCRSRGPR